MTIRYWPNRRLEKRTFLLWMTSYFRSQLDKTLQVLGIEAPPYM